MEHGTFVFDRVDSIIDQSNDGNYGGLKRRHETVRQLLTPIGQAGHTVSPIGQAGHKLSPIVQAGHRLSPICQAGYRLSLIGQGWAVISDMIMTWRNSKALSCLNCD